MAGFISGEGCFSVHTTKSDNGKQNLVSLSFRVSQHIRDEELLKSFVNFFGCGFFNYHNSNKKSGVFIVRKFQDNFEKIIPFFRDHKIKGIKGKDFND